MIKSHDAKSIKRPIDLVAGPIVWEILRYYMEKITGYDLIISKEYGREYFGCI